MMQQVSMEIMEFVETQILPKYTEFGESHGLRHVNRVIKNSLELARITGADINMVYVVAAYHDLGMSGPRSIHHITSGKILMADARLKRWFSQDQIKIMKEAVEDHRASSKNEPRTIYGKLIAESDRQIVPLTVIRRTVQYGFAHYPELDKEGHWVRTVEHLKEKYAEGGYLKLWIPESENRERLKELRAIIEDRKLLRSIFEKEYAAACCSIPTKL